MKSKRTGTSALILALIVLTAGSAVVAGLASHYFLTATGSSAQNVQTETQVPVAPTVGCGDVGDLVNADGTPYSWGNYGAEAQAYNPITGTPCS